MRLGWMPLPRARRTWMRSIGPGWAEAMRRLPGTAAAILSVGGSEPEPIASVPPAGGRRVV